MNDLKRSEYKIVREFIDMGELELAESLQQLCERWKKQGKDPHFLDRLDEDVIDTEEAWERIVRSVEGG